MGVSLCYQWKEEKDIPYDSNGNIIILNFRTNEESYEKPISIHDENILKKAIQLYRQSLGKNNKIKDAVYELTSSKLNLYSKINELNIDYSGTILVTFYD